MTPLQAMRAFYSGVILRTDGRHVVVEFEPGKQTPEREAAIRAYVAAREDEIARELSKRR